MVSAALASRESRVKSARIAATTTSIAFYQKEFELAQTQALTVRRQLDQFNAAHSGRLSAADEYEQNQLRLAVDVAQTRLTDLRQQLERGTVSTALLDMAESVRFQVIDRPRAEPFPSGGTRSAGLLLGLALAGGVALVVAVVMAATLLDDRIKGESDIAEFATGKLFADLPRRNSGTRTRSELVSVAFGEAAPANWRTA
jgi:uncharacterized protein involved in exopolysaccharide biosynthesis